MGIFRFIAFLPLDSFAADDSVCARVKIEILQELTLERQAFDAHMRINNGLSGISLEYVNIDVSLVDKNGNTVRGTFDPDDATALFFIRVNSMENISNIDGQGAVQPSSNADIHFRPIWAEMRDILYRLLLTRWRDVQMIYQSAGERMPHRPKELWKPLDSVLTLEEGLYAEPAGLAARPMLYGLSEKHECASDKQD